MTDWPRIMCDVDDDRPARDDEVEYCDNCEGVFLEGELRRADDDVYLCSECWKECFPFCALGCGTAVEKPGEFCETCAYWAMGVEV